MRLGKALIAVALAAAAIIGTSGLTSCRTPKDITYFQDLDEGTQREIAAATDIKAKPDDRLSIYVISKDPQLASLFNLTIQNRPTSGNGITVQTTSSSSQTASYVVDRYGDIQFPILGTLHIDGMRRQEISEYIQKELMQRNLVKDPTVIVDFLNHGITVLGEVSRPGRVDFDRDRFTILDAIAGAGDLTMNGKRTNVKVLRTEEGRQTTYIVDLTNASQLLQSPVYYLQSDDVVYVEPDDYKKRSITPNGNSVFTPAFWISLASFATTIAVLIIK